MVNFESNLRKTRDTAGIQVNNNNKSFKSNERIILINDHEIDL